MKKNRNAPGEVHDLKTDIDETIDVAAQHPELVKRFEEILRAQHHPSQNKDRAFIDPKFQ